MKSLIVALVIVLVINVLLLAAGVGYLAATDRLNQQRIEQAIELFKPTIAEEEAAAEEAAELAERKAAEQQEALRLAEVADGPMTQEQRLLRQQQLNDVLAQQSERLQRDQQDIIRQVQAAKEVIKKRREEIEAREQAFEERVAAYEQQREADDFKQAVQMMEQLKPKQAKEVFQSMLVSDDREMAVTYLSAMNPRKAGAVLREFKTDAELLQAEVLIEGLRLQGQTLTDAGGV